MCLDFVPSSIGKDVNDSNVAKDEASLEGFQSHVNLKRLCLEDYRGSNAAISILY
jgi:hypothetical protein